MTTDINDAAALRDFIFRLTDGAWNTEDTISLDDDSLAVIDAIRAAR